MIGYQITHIKDFMNKLLTAELFDTFLLLEASITTSTAFLLDGTLKKDFFTPEEWDELQTAQQKYTYWHDIKPICFQIIKGKKTPLSFKFVFQLAPYNVEKLLAKSESGFTANDVVGLILTIHFENGKLFCTTATSMKIFSLEKTLEKEWDNMVSRFFDAHNIEYTLS